MAKASQTRRSSRRRVTVRIRRKVTPPGKAKCNMCHGTGYVKRRPRKGR